MVLVNEALADRLLHAGRRERHPARSRRRDGPRARAHARAPGPALRSRHRTRRRRRGRRAARASAPSTKATRPSPATPPCSAGCGREPPSASPASSSGCQDQMARDYPDIPALIRESVVFQYVAGVNFVSWAYKNAGWEGVNALLARPPRSTEQILHPGEVLRAPGEPGARPARRARAVPARRVAARRRGDARRVHHPAARRALLRSRPRRGRSRRDGTAIA